MSRRIAQLACLIAACAVGLAGQVVATFSAGAAVSHAGLSAPPWTAGAAFGMALTPRQRSWQLDWNAVELTAGRTSLGFTGAVDTNLEAWLSPGFDLRRAGPVLLAQTGVGRQWGGGISGFGLWGLGAGWRVHDLVPYLEYRRRAPFHAGPGDYDLLVGIHWFLWE